MSKYLLVCYPQDLVILAIIPVAYFVRFSQRFAYVSERPFSSLYVFGNYFCKLPVYMGQ